jgi:ribosomal protein S27E
MTNVQPLTQRFPCPGCGSTLEFDPGSSRLKCPYCGREEDTPQAAGQVEERSFQAFANQNQTQIAALSTTALEVECPGCRAQITFEPPDVAGKCPFCATSIVTQPHAPNPVLMPEAVLPFCIGQKVAKEKVQNWIKTRWFAPSGLKKLAQHEGMQGVYLPFWTYDAQTHSYYRGERGTYYYVTETYTETNAEGKTETKTRQVRHTRWNSVCGEIDRFFDDLLIPAVELVDVKRLEALEPWDLSKLVAYHSSYLAGFKAQRYQVSLEQGFDRAKEQMAHALHEAVRRDIGGDEQRVHAISTEHNAVTFKHILLPIWLSSYRYRNKRYQVIVNAQTGEVLGDRPYSVWRIMGTIAAGILLTVGTLFGIGVFTEEPPVLPDPSTPGVPNPLGSELPFDPYPGYSPVPAESYQAFRDALRLAEQTGSLTSSAQTKQDWQSIVNGWTQSIELLKQVVPESPDYDRAQQKIQEYQNNLNYARQQMERSP